VSRWALQVNALEEISKGDTVVVAEALRLAAIRNHIEPGRLMVDRTGNGAGVHDLLVSQFHASTRGINPSSSPTERKILEEDQKLPCDEYVDLVSELWFATQKYIEYGFMKLHPNVPQDPLIAELTGRWFNPAGKKTKVESNKSYKSRGNKSPDRASAVTILVHVCRQNCSGPPSAIRNTARDDDRPYDQRIGMTDHMDFLD
jgi:hypothetical protein